MIEVHERRFVERFYNVFAGHRSSFNVVKSFNKSSLLEMIEVHERNNDFVPTHFGYSVQEYPLTEIPEELIEDFIHVAKLNKKCNEIYEENSKLTQASDDDSIFMRQTENSNKDLLSVKNENFLRNPTKSSSNIASDKTEVAPLKTAYEDCEDAQSMEARRKVEDFIKNFQPCQLQTSDLSGCFNFDNLYLLKPAEAFEDILTSFDQEKTEKEMDAPLEEFESVTNTNKKTNKSHKTKKAADKRSSMNKSNRRLSRTKQIAVELKEVEDDYEHIKLKIDKFVNRISRRGEFVLVIKEVTNPPFLDKILPPIYLQIHLKQPDIPKIIDSV